MTIKYSRAYARKDNSVEFYIDTPEFLQYITDTYINTGLCLKFREMTYIDENQLVAEFVSIWIDNETALQAKNDPRMLAEDKIRRAYNEQVKKITLLYVTQEEVEDE